MKSIFSLDRHVDLHLSDVFERKTFVEEPDERAHGATCVVVFCFAKKQRRSAFDISKINVVAERRTFDLAGTRNNEDNFRLGIVPRGHRMKAGVVAVPDGRHWLGLGEELGIWSNPDLQVLRPESLPCQEFLQ